MGEAVGLPDCRADLSFVACHFVIYLLHDSTIVSFMKELLGASAGFSRLAVIFQLLCFTRDKLAWLWELLWPTDSCSVFCRDLMLRNTGLFSAVVPHTEPVSVTFLAIAFLLKWKPFCQNSKLLRDKKNEDSCILLSEIL